MDNPKKDLEDTMRSIAESVMLTDDTSRADLLELIVRVRVALMGLRLIDSMIVDDVLITKIRDQIVPSIDTLLIVMSHRLGYDVGSIMKLTADLFGDIADDSMEKTNREDETEG